MSTLGSPFIVLCSARRLAALPLLLLSQLASAEPSTEVPTINDPSVAEDPPADTAAIDSASDEPSTFDETPALEGSSDGSSPVAASDAVDSQPNSATAQQGVVDAGPETNPDQTDKPKARMNISFVGGYAAASGNLVEDSALAETIDGAVPIGLDARIISRQGYVLGAFLVVAPGFAGAQLDGCDDCSLVGGRAGLQIGRHFAPTSFLDPWITAGVAYEFLSISQKTQIAALTNSGDVVFVDGTRKVTASALPEVLLQVGLDMNMGSVNVGPYAFATWSRFNEVETELQCDALVCAGEDLSSDSSDISSDQRSSHYWLGAGLRVGYDL